MELTEAAKEARRAYKAAWARRNPDKVRAQQARYWERRAAKGQQKQTEHVVQSLEGGEQEA